MSVETTIAVSVRKPLLNLKTRLTVGQGWHGLCNASWQMEERPRHHLTVIVGAAEIADELRRSLVISGVSHAGVTTHLRGLRKSMVLGENEFVVLCIALDQATLTRHGSALRTMLADHRCFPKAVRSVGLLTDLGFTSDVAAMGCDVYVQDSTQAAKTVALLTRRWERQQARAEADEVCKQLEAEIVTDPTVCDSWLCGEPELPSELASLMADRSRSDVENPTLSQDPDRPETNGDRQGSPNDSD